MNIVIFGASGKLGQRLVRQALDRGHSVTAFVRRPKDLNLSHDRLRLQVGDIYQPEAVIEAVAGQEAVLSALGRDGATSPPICRDGLRAILPAMEQHGVERLVAVSAFGASEQRNLNLYTRLLRLVIGRHMRDKDEMETLIKASQTAWTILRPGAYSDASVKKGYELLNSLPGPYPTVTRGAVAAAMLDQLEKEDYLRQNPAVRGK